MSKMTDTDECKHVSLRRGRKQEKKIIEIEPLETLFGTTRHLYACMHTIVHIDVCQKMDSVNILYMCMGVMYNILL